MSTTLLSGQVAIVTGGASGIGRATALQFAEHGAAVMVADVDAEGGAATVAAIAGGGGDAAFTATDVSSADDAAAMAGAAMDRWGKIDILFNNAAATRLCNDHDRSVHELEEWVWDKMLAVCLKSMYLCSRACLPSMMERRRGAIINVTSIDAVLAEPGFDSYTAAKGGVISLTRSMAARYGTHGVRVNALCPGYILTECQADWYTRDPAAAARADAAHALGRIGRPVEVANAAVFLASGLASFVTGALLPVDGGYAAFKDTNADAFARSS